MEEVVQRWWNGTWGRLARRDVWLVRQTRWTVTARAGDAETGKVLRWEFDTEPEAMQMVDRLLHADTAGQWRQQEPGAPPRPQQACNEQPTNRVQPRKRTQERHP
ncbi:hypothetical protein [Micromonospora aurantiaca (nom. illeg.)]|uniref:hypothetical protein n=1 Tax=Micromonospora aurantiaca (nom. illeg.) TaxID=47850 RepID=UPI0037B4D627